MLILDLNGKTAALPDRNFKMFSTEAQAVADEGENNVVGNKEKIIGEADHHEFQAETAELLNIVAKSLYSENEVNHCANDNMLASVKQVIICKLKYRKILVQLKNDFGLYECSKFRMY